MEKEIEEIRKRIEEFMEKYNVEVKIETTSYGRLINGRLAEPREKFIIYD